MLEFLPYAALKVIVGCNVQGYTFFVVFGTSLPHFFISERLSGVARADGIKEECQQRKKKNDCLAVANTGKCESKD